MIPARRTGHMIAQDTGQTEVLSMARDEVKVSKNAKKGGGQYPAFLTEYA